jgi:hypothetical protein
MHSWLAEGPGNPISVHRALMPPANEKFTVGSSPDCRVDTTISVGHITERWLVTKCGAPFGDDRQPVVNEIGWFGISQAAIGIRWRQVGLSPI